MNIDKVNQCVVTISLGTHRLRIAYVDPVQRQCIGLEAYAFDFSLDDEASCLKLQNFIQKHAFLSRFDWKGVFLAFENQQYTLVPLAAFEPSAQLDYARLAIGVDKTASVHACHDLTLGLTVVFCAPREIVGWLQQFYQATPTYIIHQANLMIAVHHAYCEHENQPSIMIHTEAGYFHISAMNQHKLMYYNRFAYHTVESCLQYITMVIQHLRATIATPLLMVTGSAIQDKIVYKGLRAHLPNLQAITKPAKGLRCSQGCNQSIIGQHLDIVNWLGAMGPQGGNSRGW